MLKKTNCFFVTFDFLFQLGLLPVDLAKENGHSVVVGLMTKVSAPSQKGDSGKSYQTVDASSFDVLLPVSVPG